MPRLTHYTAFLPLLLAVNAIHAQRNAPHEITPRVAIAAHDLQRGTVLSATDIAWASDSTTATPTRAARATNQATSMQSMPQHTPPETVAPGWVARRNIRAGELLEEPSVTRPDLISTGDLVDVIYREDGVSIKLRGTAVGNGAQGDEIYVKLDNRRRLRGIVDGANTVRIL